MRLLPRPVLTSVLWGPRPLLMKSCITLTGIMFALCVKAASRSPEFAFLLRKGRRLFVVSCDIGHCCLRVCIFFFFYTVDTRLPAVSTEYKAKNCYKDDLTIELPKNVLLLLNTAVQGPPPEPTIA